MLPPMGSVLWFVKESPKEKIGVRRVNVIPREVRLKYEKRSIAVILRAKK